MPHKDKEAQRLYKRKHYLENKEKYKVSYKRSRNKRKDFVDSLKIGQPCMDCKMEWPPCAMDFHHRDKKDKFSSINQLRKHSSIEKIIEEVKKCDLICASCHRVREYGSLV